MPAACTPHRVEEELQKCEPSSELERFRAPESLFLGLEQEGVHRLTLNSIMKSALDKRKDLYGDSRMSGGTTMYEDIPECVQKEVKARRADTTRGLSLSADRVRVERHTAMAQHRRREATRATGAASGWTRRCK